MMLGGLDELKKLEGYETVGFDVADIYKNSAAKHSFSANIHGWIYNALIEQLYTKWGFHPFDDIKVENVEKMKIVITYGEKDPSSPEAHGEYMAKYYSEKCNKDGQMFKNGTPQDVVGNDKGGKCMVNHRPGGHEAHMIHFFRADLLRHMLEL